MGIEVNEFLDKVRMPNTRSMSAQKNDDGPSRPMNLHYQTQYMTIKQIKPGNDVSIQSMNPESL
jgi:hypothetical protein